jgi:hypothetical protein
MRANTANITISNKNAANIGAANLRPAINIAEVDLLIPSARTGIVGVVPGGKAS